MKILIDARVIYDKMHGIARYSYNLIENIKKIDTENEYILLSGYEELRNLCSGYRNFRFIRCNTPLYSFQEQFVIPFILKREEVDIYHSPTFSAPLYQPCKVVMTLHDMMHLIFGKYIHRSYYKYIVKRAVMKSSCIITVSEYSKNDIAKFLGIPKEKIYVTCNGVNGKFKPASEKKISEDKYILFVGNQKPHKNVNGLLKAFKVAVENISLSHSLVIVGIEKDFVIPILEKEGIRGWLGNKIVLVKNHTDDELIKLYQSADLFLSPSLYEGFGLPILEAMACGVPVITSNRTSIPEVTGNAAILVDPENIQEIADAICKVLKDENLKSTLIRTGLEQAKMFSWRKMAEETLELYKRVYESSNNP